MSYATLTLVIGLDLKRDRYQPFTELLHKGL